MVLVGRFVDPFEDSPDRFPKLAIELLVKNEQQNGVQWRVGVSKPVTDVVHRLGHATIAVDLERPCHTENGEEKDESTGYGVKTNNCFQVLGSARSGRSIGSS